MRIVTFVLVFCFFCPLFSQAIAGTVSETANFDGVTRQSYDNSCGAAALSTLLRGVSFRKEVTELDVLKTKKDGPLDSIGKTGFSMKDLMEAARIFGHKAEWRKISRSDLHLIREPVIILIGLNSEIPHYVVLKGVREGVAYLADPMRGNIRISYEELSSESLNEKYPGWYVMAVNRDRDIGASADNRALFISENKDERDRSHVYYNRLDLAGLVIMPKSGDFMFEHTIGVARLHDNESAGKTDMTSISNMFTVRYGVLKNTEIVGGLSFADNTSEFDFGGIRYAESVFNSSAMLSVNQKLRVLDSAGQDGGFILGLGGSYSFDDDDMDLEGSVLGYYSNNVDQFVAGGNFSKKIRDDSEIGTRYVASLLAAYNRSVSKSSVLSMSGAIEYEKVYAYPVIHNYRISLGLSKTLPGNLQVSPVLTYRFGDISGIEFSVSTLVW